MINKKTLGFSVILSGAALFALAADVQADSLRIQWNNNKHFYQRFDQSITWANAKNKCQTLGAHLVTVTSDAERGFIYNSLSRGAFWIGGSDAALEGKFTWVTGEKWVYQYWSSNEANTTDEDYIVAGYNSSANGSWSTRPVNETYNYICEWSANNYVGLATVPDLNNNGSDEIAALYVDYVTAKHIVKIRDPKTDTLLSTLIFKNGLAAPQGLVSIADINGNGVPEIGVLYSEYGQPSVLIKDAKDNRALLNTLRFLNSTYDPKEITVSPDSNGNGSSEITVLGIGKQSNAPKAQTLDSDTGAILNDTSF